MSENKPQSPEETQPFTWESDPRLKDSVETWQAAHENYQTTNLDAGIEIEKKDEHAPDFPREFIDFLIGIARKRVPTGVLENIQRVVVHYGGGKILLGLSMKNQPKLIHFWFEPDPPFEIYNISQ